MADDPLLLGLPVRDAVESMRARGVEPRIVLSREPRTENPSGTLRVVRVQNDTLTVCAFPDGTPGVPEDQSSPTEVTQ